MNRFSIVDTGSDIVEEGEAAPLAVPDERPMVVGRLTPRADSTSCSSDDKIRVAACAAVRRYDGRDAFVLSVKAAHAGQRGWLPKRRVAEALLSIIDGLQANGAAMR